MSSGSIGDHLWAEMTDGQKVEAVYKGQATLKQMSEGLLDGSDDLRKACREILAHTDPSFENLVVDDGHLDSLADALALAAQKLGSKTRPTTKRNSQTAKASSKQRFGLPHGFVPRLQRYGRAVLLELNVYRLPDGQEFIPVHPTGTLGTRQHLYALLNAEQYLKDRCGSVYVRLDGRIFDYSVDSENLSGDIFDTGYTIYDLERTGRYAPIKPKRRKKSKKRQQLKYRRAAAAS
ncbi:MAG TPA: hypothetical protein VNO50_04145 [Pyrinomonadaceae bacterium]|nr:hypothetical protein [Pyrinomonadaceae bacterium]